MSRDMDKNPYSPDEKRVAEFFFERGVGGGDDPIGFILASYAMLIEERNMLRRQVADPAAISARKMMDLFFGRTKP